MQSSAKVLSKALSAAASLTAVLASPAAFAEWISGEEAIMGTAIRVELWHADPAQGREAVSAVMDEMRRIDALMSTYKDDSEISSVNREAAAHAVEVSTELASLVQRALEFGVVTRGAFDITYASVGFLYDYRERVRPDEAARERALATVDYHNVEVDSGARTVHFAREGVRIDLGGIAKGYAVERGVELLRRRGIEHAIVSAGGDSRILGDRRGRPWVVGIRDPRHREGVATRIPLADEAISTSGDYERYFEAEGVRYHHIIKPSTGVSPSEVHSVTVIGPDATMTDALSTGVFVLGVEDGLEVIESLPGFEAVIIDASGLMHYSQGLAAPASADAHAGAD